MFSFLYIVDFQHITLICFTFFSANYLQFLQKEYGFAQII